MKWCSNNNASHAKLNWISLFRALAIFLCLILTLWGVPQTNKILAASPATDCTFTFYNASGQDITRTLNQDMGNITVNVKSDKLRSANYVAQLFWNQVGPGNQVGPLQKTKLENGTINPPLAFQYSGRWPPGKYGLYFYEGDQARPIQNIKPDEVGFCSYGFALSLTPEKSCTAVIETTKIDPNTPVIVNLDKSVLDQRYTCGGPNNINGGYHVYVYRSADTTKPFRGPFDYCPGGNNSIDLGTYLDGSYTVAITRRCGPTDFGCNESDLQCNTVPFQVPSDNSKYTFSFSPL